MAEQEEVNKSKVLWKSSVQKTIMEKEIIEAMNESKKKKRRTKRLKRMCVKGLKFFLSTGGLLLLNALYLVVGAFIFEHLEQKNEQENCDAGAQEYHDSENATVILLMDMAQTIDGLQENQRKEKFEGYLRKFAQSVLDIGHDVSVDCSQLGKPGGNDYDWSWTGSLVFSVTIITTIGYGHIAPATMWGRLVCIAYATIGIPIFLMAMSNIGEVLANLFITTYSTVCCCGCCRKKEEKEKTEEEIAKEEEFARQQIAVWRIDEVTGRPIPPSEDDLLEDDEIEQAEEQEEMTVPLTITLLVMAGCIIFGAIMFHSWEEWTFTDACYYCYITLTTIGFGDIVPGLDLTDALSVIKSLATIFYIIFGMAAISMCIQLMADEIVAKFKWIGEKVGLRKKEETTQNDGDEIEEEVKDDNAEDKGKKKIKDIENGRKTRKKN